MSGVCVVVSLGVQHRNHVDTLTKAVKEIDEANMQHVTTPMIGRAQVTAAPRNFSLLTYKGQGWPGEEPRMEPLPRSF